MKILMTDESGALIGDSSSGMLAKSVPAFGAVPLHREPAVVFTKSHVKAHTRKDGTFVKDYDTKTQKKAGSDNPLPDNHNFHKMLGEMADGDTHHFQNSKFKSEKISVTKNGDKYHIGGPVVKMFGGGGDYSHKDAADKLTRIHKPTGSDMMHERLVHIGTTSSAK